MNKGERHKIKMLKYKKRLINYNLTREEGNFYSFRSHGSPCSCCMCRDEKYRDSRQKHNILNHGKI
jgi:hypothetical protein